MTAAHGGRAHVAANSEEARGLAHGIVGFVIAASNAPYGSCSPWPANRHCPAPAHPAVPPPHPAARLEMGEAIREFYGEDPKQSPDYGRVINDRNLMRPRSIGPGDPRRR